MREYSDLLKAQHWRKGPQFNAVMRPLAQLVLADRHVSRVVRKVCDPDLIMCASTDG